MTNNVNSIKLIVMFFWTFLRTISHLIINCWNKIASMFRRKQTMNNQLKDIFHLVDQLLKENHLFQNRFHQLDTRYQQWMTDERIHLNKRIEMLENENHQLYELYFTYQIQNEKSITAIINLILQILSTQQELRQQQSVDDDSVQWRKKRQQTTRSSSCHFDTYQWDDNQYTNNGRSICFNEQDQQTRNSSSLEHPNHSSNVATVKSKRSKSPTPPPLTTTTTALSNQIYYVLNNERPAAATAAMKSTGIPRTPVNDGNRIANCKQQSSVTFKKKPSQTHSVTSNHQRLTTQTSNRTSSTVKTTPTNKPRIPTTTTTTNPRTRPSPTKNSKVVVATADRPVHPRYTIPKLSESPVRPTVTTTRSRPGKPPISPPKKPVKTSIPILTSTTARVTDLDALIAEQEKQRTIATSTNIIPSTLIQSALFSKDTVKHVRPVRSEQLKLFSCHLTTDKPLSTQESASTLTPSLHNSINENTHSDGIRDFSEDSLNEHNHIQKILQQNSISIEPDTKEMPIEHVYSLSLTDDVNPPYAPPLSSSSIIPERPNSSLVHRLVFPERLNRLIFYRRTFSDTDIYQKNCSKDQEIFHHVYHLDTVRDYSMEYYMLTTYASDSQLRAWLDDDDDEIDQHFNGNRFLSSEENINTNPRTRKITSSDNLIQEEELDWCSELQLIHLSKEDAFSGTPPRQSYPARQTSSEFDQPRLTSIPSDRSDSSSNLLREILNNSWPEHLSSSASLEHEPGIEQFENDSTSSIITDEFQRDFYYLCPISKTTSFVRTDSKV